MATTISGPTVNNDTGTVANPNEDGTNLNQSFFDSFYSAINAMWSGATQIFDGVLTVGGLGTHSFVAGGAGVNALRVQNNTDGGVRAGQVEVGNSADADLGILAAYAPSYSASGPAQQNGVALRAAGAGGLHLSAEAGDLVLYGNGTTKIATFDGDTFTLSGGVAGTHALSGTLDTNVTQLGNNADTNYRTAWSYTLPAGALASAGQRIRIRAIGTNAANNNTKNLRINFGSTAMTFTFSGSGTSGGQWEAYADVIRVDGTNQKMFGTVHSAQDGGNYSYQVGTNENYYEPTETLSGTVAITFQVQSAASAANDMVFEFGVIEFWP